MPLARRLLLSSLPICAAGGYYLGRKQTRNDNARIVQETNKILSTQTDAAATPTTKSSEVLPSSAPNASLFYNGPNALDIQLSSAIERSRHIVEQLRETSACPGLVVGVSIDGRPVWRQGFGYADVENMTPCHAQTVMRIASISKSITMAIAAELIDAGKLDLDRHVSEYVAMPQDGIGKSEMTVRQLASHLAGVRHYRSIAASSGTVTDSESPTKSSSTQTLENGGDSKFPEFLSKRRFSSVTESLSVFIDDPLLHAPGSKYHYSTYGYVLLSAVLESCSGKSFPDLVSDFTKRVGMHATRLDQHEPIVAYRSHYYHRPPNGSKSLINAPYVDNSGKWAGGGLLSDVSDLLRFAAALQASMQHSPPTLLRRETIRELWTGIDAATDDPSKSEKRYGLGFSVLPASGVERASCAARQPIVVSHSGGAVGASSVLVIVPNEEKAVTAASPIRGITVAVICNLTNVSLEKAAMEICKNFDGVKI